MKKKITIIIAVILLICFAAGVFLLKEYKLEKNRETTKTDSV